MPRTRAVRRKWSRDFDIPWSTMKQGTKLVQGVPNGIYWPKKDYAVNFHIYSHCPTLFKEWAGEGYYVKPISYIKATTTLKGVCRHCFERWTAEVGR